ncbi:uncharacterized protein LOC143237423 isoform X2 [Tachypleus tridentatus]|uniref:uncharacterized protein LOC143237423 isoform X2 n=1 Tax=Tachypleus tridentatus TaxID=6853 RepID=UPI003FD03FD9
MRNVFRLIREQYSIGMAYDNIYCGTWKITSCNSIPGESGASGIEGTEFTLSENGDVIWKVKEGTEPMPFFNCETYEVTVNESKYDRPFSLLCLLEMGYLSDMKITSSNGQEFLVHSTILNVANPSINWTQPSCPLQGLPEDVLYATLYYLYCECLVSGLQEETAKSCLQYVGQLPGFSRFAEMCKQVLKSFSLKQQLLSLVNDIHTCACNMVDYFNGITLGSQFNDGNGAARLYCVIKQTLKEVAVAGASLLLLCDLVYWRNHELLTEERYEVLKYCKSRLPVFLDQIQKFIEVIREMITNFSREEMLTITHYVVLETEGRFEVLIQLLVEVRTALKQVINGTEERNNSQNLKEGDVLSSSVKNTLRMKELSKLRNFHERFNMWLQNLLRKKESIPSFTKDDKTRFIFHIFEHLDDKLPMLFVGIKELQAAIDENLTIEEWKSIFKLGTSKVAWLLNNVMSYRSTLQKALNSINEFVNHEQFTHNLVQLGLLDPQNPLTHIENMSSTSRSYNHSPSRASRVNFTNLLFQPPLSKNSLLGKSFIELFKNGQETDMMFRLIKVHDATDTVIDYTHGYPIDQSTIEHEIEIHEIKAHSVVIAAYCDWFRQTLISQESTDRTIVVHDSSPEIFRMFLEYLYGGHLETRQLSMEQLAHLMFLSEKYQVNPLKHQLEETFENLIDEDTAFLILVIGVQFKCNTLRNTALDFIAVKNIAINKDSFIGHPECVKSEIMDIITGAEVSDEVLCPSQSEAASSSFISEAFKGLKELTPDLEVSINEEIQAASICNSPQNTREEDTCVTELRNLVGECLPHEELLHICQVASCDVNQALDLLLC